MSVDPHAQLGFSRPLTQVAKKTLTITNSNAQPVAFKVKTTAPKQYCVRPNSGRIEAGERVDVQVILQPLKEEPPASTKCRDKFLVQSAVITAAKETLPIAEFWALQEREKQSISEHKIRCVFLPPSSATVLEESESGDYDQSQGVLDKAKAAAAATAATAAATAGTAYTAVRDQGARVVNQASAPLTSSTTTTRGDVAPPISIASLHSNGLTSPVATSPYTSSTTSAVPVANYTSSSSAYPRSVDELESEVKRLRAQLAATSGGPVRSGALATKSAGVPVHITAAIAVGVFAITYLFF